MNEPKVRRALFAVPIFVLAAIAIVLSIQAVGCGDDYCNARAGECD
jgi:hypothetical protein